MSSTDNEEEVEYYADTIDPFALLTPSTQWGVFTTNNTVDPVKSGLNEADARRVAKTLNESR